VLVSNLCLRRALGTRVGQGRPRIREIVRLGRVSIPLAGTVLIKFGGLGVVTFAASATGTRDVAAHAVLSTLTGFIMLASISVAQAVQGIGLTALKRSGASLIYFAVGYGVMVAVAAPVAAAWGLVGLWWLMAVTNGVLVVLQGTGFHRHSATVGAASVGA
jgi:MATE family multidrug resistance protein